MNLLRKKRFFIPALLLVVLLLWEAGIFRVEYYSAGGDFRLSTNYNSMMLDKENSASSSELPLYSESEFPLVLVVVDGDTYSYGNLHGRDTCDIYVDYSVNGFPWIPFHASFSVDCSGSFDHEHRYYDTGNPTLEGRRCSASGTVFGELSMTISGLCSYRETRSRIRRKLADAFAARVTDALANSMKMFGSAPESICSWQNSANNTVNFNDSYKGFGISFSL